MTTKLLNKAVMINPTDGQERGCIRLRMASFDDGKLISDYYARNKQHLKPWEPTRDEAFYCYDEWQKKLKKLVQLQLLGMGFYCLILDIAETCVLGVITFSQVSRFPFHACNVGYSLCHTQQGKGIMRHALKEACDYMFAEQNLHRIMAGYMPVNKRSECVLHSVGFEKEGYAQDYLLINGQWEDHVLVALTNKEWQQR